MFVVPSSLQSLPTLDSTPPSTRLSSFPPSIVRSAKIAHQATRRGTLLNMRTDQAELIQKTANSIREGYGSWKNKLCTYQQPVANHFVSGLVRNTMDTVLCNAILAHTDQPKVRQVLTQLSKTMGLAAQISVLAPGAFSPKMAVIIGIGGSISHTVKSLARLLGHVYLAKSLLAISRGDQLALVSLLASVAGAYAGTALGNTLYQPKKTEPQNCSEGKEAGTSLIQCLKTIDQSAGKTIDTYLHFNFLIKHLFPAINLASAQPALTARVINNH